MSAIKISAFDELPSGEEHKKKAFSNLSLQSPTESADDELGLNEN